MAANFIFKFKSHNLLFNIQKLYNYLSRKYKTGSRGRGLSNAKLGILSLCPFQLCMYNLVLVLQLDLLFYFYKVFCSCSHILLLLFLLLSLVQSEYLKLVKANSINSRVKKYLAVCVWCGCGLFPIKTEISAIIGSFTKHYGAEQVPSLHSSVSCLGPIINQTSSIFISKQINKINKIQ